jgi:membrane-associated phospholipid phosphatase
MLTPMMVAFMGRKVACTIAFMLAATFAMPASAVDESRLDLRAPIAVVGGALASTLILYWAQDRLAPSSCRICTTNSLDDGIRNRLVWSHPLYAKHISDGLAVTIPMAGVTTAFLVGQDYAGNRRGFEDALLVGEAASLAVLGSQIFKVIAARERPFALHQTDTYPDDTDAHLSFWSMHTALTTSVATSLAVVAYRRGYRGWPWMLGAGLGLAFGTGYLRIGADKHWFTDVLVGALWGCAVGLAVPLIQLRSKTPDSSNTQVSPLGIGGTF